MTDREKLIELFNECEQIRATSDKDKLIELMKPILCNKYLDKTTWIEFMAEWLVAHGVTFATDNSVVGDKLTPTTESLTNGQQWIPVTERLPSKNANV